MDKTMGSKVSIQDIDQKANSKQFLENRIHELEGELYQLIHERDDYKAANKALLIKNSQLAQQLADCKEPKELEDKWATKQQPIQVLFQFWRNPSNN